jgi:hypothetical protein
MSSSDKAEWLRAYARGLFEGNLYKTLHEFAYSKELRFQVEKPKAFLNSSDGPMIWLGDQIVKRMEKAGWPSKVYYGYRSPELQTKLYNRRVKGRRVTNAKAYESPHNFYEAVDIVHSTLYWNAPPEYWEALAQCVRVVEAEYNVELTHGHYWKTIVDSAHIELTNWRIVKARQSRKRGDYWPPTKQELVDRFDEVIPAIWRSKHRMSLTDMDDVSASL